MKALKSKYIVRLYDTFETKDNVCLLLEYCSGGTLMQHVVKKKPNEEDCLKIFL